MACCLNSKLFLFYPKSNGYVSNLNTFNLLCFKAHINDKLTDIIFNNLYLYLYFWLNIVFFFALKGIYLVELCRWFFYSFALYWRCPNSCFIQHSIFWLSVAVCLARSLLCVLLLINLLLWLLFCALPKAAKAITIVRWPWTLSNTDKHTHTHTCVHRGEQNYLIDIYCILIEEKKKSHLQCTHNALFMPECRPNIFLGTHSTQRSCNSA